MYYKVKPKTISYKTLVKHGGDIYKVQSIVNNCVQVQSCEYPFVIKQLNINEIEVIF